MNNEIFKMLLDFIILQLEDSQFIVEIEEFYIDNDVKLSDEELDELLDRLVDKLLSIKASL